LNRSRMYTVEFGPYMLGIVKIGRGRMDAGTAAALCVAGTAAT
jgi:hypothetical protein